MHRSPAHRIALGNSALCFNDSSEVRWEKTYVRILQDLTIHRDEWSVQNAGCRDNDLVSGVTVECARKLRGLHADARGKFDEPYAGIGESLLNPIVNRTRQGKPTALDQLGDFPA